MLKEIRENNLSDAVNFAWEYSKKTETASYPLYKEKFKIEEEFNKCLCEKNSRLFGYFINNKITAVV